MSYKKRTFLALLAPSLFFGTTLAGQAEETLIERHTVIQHSASSPAVAPGSTVVVEGQSGVLGFRTANKFAPHFKDRLNTYAEQMEMARTKGWLNAAQLSTFQSELDRLNALEASVAAKGFVKPDVDDLDKQITKFNADFTTASGKQSGNATSSTSTTIKTK